MSTESEYMPKMSYDILDRPGMLGNEAEYALDAIGDAIAALYPDNSRIVKRQDAVDSLEYFRKAAADYIAAVESLLNPA